MQIKPFLTKYGAYLLAIVLFIALGFIYCKPVLSGKMLQAADNINATSELQEKFSVDPADGEYGFWNGSMFSGMPNYQVGGGHYRSDDLMAPLKTVFHHGPHNPAWAIIFYFLSFFALLRAFGIDKWLSIVGAIAMAFSSYFLVIIAAGHGGKTIAIAYMSVVAGGFYLIFRKKYAVGVCLTMLFTALGFSIHPQMSYYLFMMMGVFYLAEIAIHASEKRWKDLGISTAVFAAALLIGLGTGTSSIFSNIEYAEQTMRGGHSDLVSEGGEGSGKGLDLAYATQWSYGIDESFSFLIPGFKGGSSNATLGKGSLLYEELVSKGVNTKTASDFCESAPLYWGDQPFTAGNVYMGAIVCFLFVLGLLIVRGPYKWALLAATVFSVLLAWGSNFMPLTEFFFKYFPMYNKFRAVSSILIVAEITMPLLGFLALKEIFEGVPDRKKLIGSIYVSAGITAGICLIFALFGSALYSFTAPSDSAWAASVPDWLLAAVQDQRAALLKGDSWRSFAFIAAAGAVLWLHVNGKLRKPAVIALLGLLVLVDMWPVNKRYFNDRYFMNHSATTEVYRIKPYEEAILRDKDPHFRVMNLTVNTFNDGRTSYYLKSIGGYCAAKLRRYQDLIDEHLSKVHLPVVGMLNGKYIITRGEDGQPVPQRNPYALGNAWWVERISVAETPNDECAALGRIDLGAEAVVGRDFASYVKDFEPGIAADAVVRLTKYHPRFIDYESSSSQAGTIVFSEIYYPYGWKASIDGEPAEHFRANYTLRALNVPAGRHSIHFEFDPDSVRKGDTLAGICIVLMYAIIIGFVVLGIVRGCKRKEKSAE